MEVKAAIFHHPGQAEIKMLHLDAPRDHEVLIKVHAAAICHTDLKALENGLTSPPVVLGHEGAGEVIARGKDVKNLNIGDKVVMSYASCGHCLCCLSGKKSYCFSAGPLNFAARREDGSTAFTDGTTPIGSHFFGQSSFSTHTLCAAHNVVKVTTDLPMTLLAPLGCGIQTGAGAVINALMVRPGSSLVVFGTGAVGLSAIMAAHMIGVRDIIAVDLNRSRLELARNLGASNALFYDSASITEAIGAIVQNGCDYMLDTTGVPEVIENGIRSLAPLGVAGLAASPAPHKIVSLDVLKLMRGGRTIRGIVEGDSDPQSFIPQLIDWHQKGVFPFDRLTKTYDYSDINRAFKDLSAGSVIKPVLKMA